jgi:phenylpropionate dioxygenase-like ring-hydroxylating dioxygenase large terminal subunit
LQELACRIDGPLIWIAFSDQALTLEEQLQLVHTEAGAAWNTASTLLRQSRSSLACNWKIAHDNTLDDYHVAIAHPTTLHREQGPVRDYRYRFSQHNNLLETPHPDGGRFLTFGLPPWSHLLVWPDGRLAWLEFMPERPDRCTMQLHLFAGSGAMDAATADAWLRDMLTFLDEDKALVESVQQGYQGDFEPGPPHRLERRILHWQGLYRERLGSAGISIEERSQEAISALRS